jgi:hypothetical protein
MLFWAHPEGVSVKSFQSSAVVLLVATLLLGYATFSKNWLTVVDSDDSAHASLLAFEVCTHDEPCTTFPFERAGDETSTRDAVMVWAGRFSFGLGLAGAAASAVCAFLVLMYRRKTSSVVAIGLGIAAIAGGVTFLIASRPGPATLSLGVASYAYLLGAGCMIVAGAMSRSAAQ